MNAQQLDWTLPYIVPAGLGFRLTPAGNLQVADGPVDVSVEVAGSCAPLLFDFARPRAAQEAFARASDRWEVDRETYRRLLEVWIAQGLLQDTAAPSPTTTRLALFVKAMEEHAAAPSRPFPLRSHFALQRPAVYYPGLATREIHDRRSFPWVGDLERSVPVIQEELAGLLGSAEFSRVHPGQTSKGEWAAAYLWAFGERAEETCRLCPETSRLLGSIPGVAEFGTTLFSALGPRSHIAPHFGYTNSKLRCQLPLRVPRDCKLKVGDHEIDQQEGRCIIFDDSFLHSAWNGSDAARFVLVFDFFHPDLTEEEVGYVVACAKKSELSERHLAQAAAGARAEWVGKP